MRILNRRGKLRIEKSKNCSGTMRPFIKIQTLKEKNYRIEEFDLGGDAPKQFIKAYFFRSDRKKKVTGRSGWDFYIAKTAEKWYPHESVVEFMINRIGQTLGLKMNEVRLVKANGQIRFLSKYFLDSSSRLVHGAEICGEHLGDMLMAEQIANEKKTSRELFSFEFIKDAIRTVYPIDFENLLLELVKMITFDGIAGNNDRHFYNWGVIDSMKKSGKRPTFAPLYDSARGLFWNRSDSDLKHIYETSRSGGKKVVHYLKNACPRISIESNSDANHFELLDFLKQYSPEYLTIINELSSEENEKKVLNMLEREFFPMFEMERSVLIKEVLEQRFKRIRGN